MLTLHNTGQSPVVLELVERLLQHVFGVDLLHTEQVEHHVVGQVEGAVQRISRALRSTSKREMFEVHTSVGNAGLRLRR